MFVAAACITVVPTSVEPVNEIFATRGSATSALAVVEPGPGQHAQGALGKPCLVEDVGERERGERGLGRRLHDGGVAAGERGRDLPARDHRREVPRGDQRADADRLAQRDVESRWHDRDRLADDLVRRAAPVLEDVRDDVDLAARRRDRLAAVARLERRRAAPGARGSRNDAFVSSRPRSRADSRGHGAVVEGPRGDVDRARGVLGAGLRDLGHRAPPSTARSPRSVAPSAAATRSPPSTSSSVIAPPPRPVTMRIVERRRTLRPFR